MFKKTNMAALHV